MGAIDRDGGVGRRKAWCEPPSMDAEEERLEEGTVTKNELGRSWAPKVRVQGAPGRKGGRRQSRRGCHREAREAARRGSPPDRSPSPFISM